MTGNQEVRMPQRVRYALAAWAKLPGDGEAFIGIHTPWLEGYLELLERELAPKSSFSGQL